MANAFQKIDAHFLQTHLSDPFAYCLAALATSKLTRAEFLLVETFSPASF